MTHSQRPLQPRYRHPADNMGPEIYRGIDEVEGLYDQQRKNRLRTVFGRLPFEADSLIAALHRLSMGENVRRTTHEQSATRAIMDLNPERFEEYRQLAGKPELLPEFIDYFAKLAGSSVSSTPGGYLHKGPSFSLGYEIQAGVWDDIQPADTTRIGLDNAVRLLPSKMYDYAYQLNPLTGQNSKLSYKAAPVALPGVSSVELIGLERRRAIADILVDGDRKLEIAKRANALIVVEGVPDERGLRSILRDYLATLEKPDPAKPLDEDITRKVGNLFEAAKRRENRDSRFIGVLPESMTYFIRERQPRPEWPPLPPNLRAAIQEQQSDGESRR